MFFKEVVRLIKVLMFICGMYNVFGKFVVFIGLLVKSGVLGGIMIFVFLKFRKDLLF